MAKPSIDRATYEHVLRIHEHAKEHEFQTRYDHRWGSDVAQCRTCGALFDLSRNASPAHKPGCAFAASLAFMDTWLRIEEGLIREQEDAEDAA